MEITDWPYRLVDIASYGEDVKCANLSPLANAVNAANHDLISMLKPGDRILEVGCGVSSYLRDHMPEGSLWEGIDVFEKDSQGRKSIATRLGTVDAIPFDSCLFDHVVSNQSIEHWFEYDVTMEEGLREIARVMKMHGRLHINFPLHLHGHPFFVTGDIDAILCLFRVDFWKVLDITAFIDSGVPDYHGWERSGFPYWYVSRLRPVSSSYVVNIVSEKIVSRHVDVLHEERDRDVPIPVRKSLLERVLVHGPLVTSWKIKRRLVQILHTLLKKDPVTKKSVAD